MKGIGRALLLGVSSLAASSATGGAVWAQSTTDRTQTAQQKPQIETVVVTGIRGSLKDSLKIKRSSDLITENISAKDIGQLPDITIAEELNTLPGVNATRDRGNDSQAAIRGLGPRLVLGLANGEEIASSEPDQDIRWEIFPSEIVSGVQVYKTQSANLIAGGIAGVVNIQTIQPLDYNGPTITLRAGPTYNEEATSLPNYSPWGIRGSGAYVDQLTSNFAVAFGASFQREKDGYPSFQGWGYNLANGGNAPILAPSGCDDPTNPACQVGVSTSVPWGAQTEVTEIQQDRTSLVGSAQWRVNSNFELKFNNIFSHYNITENQFQQWYGRNGTWGAYNDFYPPYNPYNENGSTYVSVPGANGPDVIAADLINDYSSVTNIIAHYNEDHTLYLSGLNGKWTEGNWLGSLDLSYSGAERLNRWESVDTEVYPPTMTFSTGAGVTPSVTTPGYNPANPANQPLQSYVPGESAGPEHTKDRIGAAAADFTDSIENSFFSAVDFGARVSDRTKDHTDYQWNVYPTIGSLPPGDLSQFNVTGFTVPSMLYGNFQQLSDLAYGGFGAPPPGSNQLGEAWKVHQLDYEAYLKSEFAQNFGSVPMTGDLGVRLVSVDSTSTGWDTTNGGASYTSVAESHKYTDVLPSLNMNFHLTDEQILRFALAEAISRPPLDELRTGFSLNPTGTPPTGSGGNPQLNPYKDWQADLSYEWYFHDEALFAVAPFFKHLDTFIGYQTVPTSIGGVTYQMFEPINGKAGDIEGVELTGQSRFYFLPGPWSDFGVYSNYSFVNSDVHEFTPLRDSFEATGFAKHTAEIDLWYSKDNFEARLAFKYHSPFTVINGWDSQELLGLGAEHTLDFSSTYQIDEHFGLRFEAHNLINQPERLYWNNDPNEIAQYNIFGRSYLVDITWHD
ncbi:MAG: TonB-dependent receptor [Rhizomicrobium sp.]